jgi:FHS family L-fucose permease-like MFS transporter
MILHRLLIDFFGEDVKHSNNNVQYVYLAVAIAGVCVAAAYLFTKLPEPDASDAMAQENQIITSMDGSEESKKMTYARIFYGFATQFCYVGAQVTIGTFFLNYAHENGGFSDSKGSQMLSYGLIAFTVGRFVGTALLAFMSAPLLLGICTLACCALTCAISSLKGGSGGVICLIIIMFFGESHALSPRASSSRDADYCWSSPANRVGPVPYHLRLGYR